MTGGRGFQDWAELRAHLIDTYGDTPRPETEAVIVEAYKAHPSALEHAAQSIAVDVTAGTVRSGWAVLRSRAGSITTPQANPTRKSGVELEKRTARAKQWIHNAGMHYDRPDEIEDELFDRGLLRDYAGDNSLRDEMLHAWAEERPTGLQLERDATARAETWKAAQHLMRQKLAAAHAADDQPL